MSSTLQIRSTKSFFFFSFVFAMFPSPTAALRGARAAAAPSAIPVSHSRRPVNGGQRLSRRSMPVNVVVAAAAGGEKSSSDVRVLSTSCFRFLISSPCFASGSEEKHQDARGRQGRGNARKRCRARRDNCFFRRPNAKKKENLDPLPKKKKNLVSPTSPRSPQTSWPPLRPFKSGSRAWATQLPASPSSRPGRARSSGSSRC